MQDAEQRERGKRGNPRRQLPSPGECGAGGDQIMNQSGALGFRSVQDPAGQHHIGHPRRADQPGQMHRRAAADIDAATGLGQSEERGGVGDAQMAGARDFQPAADYRAVQDRNGRDWAAAQRSQAGMPGLRVAEHGFGVARLMFGQIEAGAEGGTVAVDHDRARFGLSAGDGGGECREQRVVDRVALGGPIEADPGDAVAKVIREKGEHDTVYRAGLGPESAHAVVRRGIVSECPPLPALPPPVIIVHVLDYVGTVVFALSGAATGLRRGMDLFGVLVLAVVTAVAGGIMRDLLIGAIPPQSVRSWHMVALAVVAGLVGARAPSLFARLRHPVQALDAAGLGVFAAAGAQKALDYGINPMMAAMLGMVTGIGGGMVRDMLSAQVPAVLRGEIYALAALLGAAMVVAGERAGLSADAALIAGAALCLFLRLMAIYRGWNLPRG